MHDDCDNEWLYEDLEDDAMMDLLIGDIVGENDLQQSNISNNIKSQKSMRIIRRIQMEHMKFMILYRKISWNCL